MDTYIPFTYLLRFKPTGQLYYGSRYGAGVHPSTLWTSYFTSSGVIADLIKEHGADAFEVEIRSTFETAEQAIKCENRVLRKFDAKRNPNWLNGTNGALNFYNAGPMSEDKKLRKLERERRTKLKNGTWHKRGPYSNKGIPRGPYGPMDDAMRIDRNARMIEARKRNGTKAGVKPKTYIVTNPSGVQFTGQDLKGFCADHDISFTSMQKVMRGAYPAYKGWTGRWSEDVREVVA